MLSSPDADVVRRDAALPGLATLLEFGELARVARDEGLPVEIPRARPVYLRYKPGTSCLAGYAATEGTEPTLFYATAFRPDSAKLLKARERKRASWLDGGGRYVLRRPATEVCFFPNDDHLPVLIDLLHPDKGSAFIGSRLRGASSLHRLETRVLAYKPERRCTLALMSDAVPAVVVKAYTRVGFSAAEARATMLQRLPGVRAQRLLSSDKSKRLLFFEWLAGRSLGEAILRGEATESELQATGATLAELHLSPAPALPVRLPVAYRRILEELVSTLQVLCPDATDDASAVAAKATSLLLLEETPSVMIHGDFYANQVLLQPDGISLLDLDRASAGSAAFDLGNFVAQLELEATRGKLPPESVATHSRNLLEGYASRRALPPEPLLAAYTAASLLALAHDPFRRHLSGWPTVIAAIVARAGSILDRAVGAADRHPSGSRGGGKVVDAAMPWLGDALEPEAAKRALDGTVEWETGPARVLNVRSARLTRHKPGRRCVIEYDIEVERGGRITSKTLIGKVRARGLDRATYSTLQELRRSGFDENAIDGIAVPAPHGKVEQFNMWLSAKVAGVPATRFLLDPWGESLGTRVAEVAHKIHTSDVVPARLHTMTDELRILADRLRYVRLRRPDLADRVEELERACQRLGAGAASNERRPIHRDFYGDQLLVSSGRSWVLDLDLFCLGDPALDIGNFLGHVTELALRTRGDPSAGAAVESALLERSAQLAGESVVERAEAFRTLTLARHLWISTQKPERNAVTEPLLELCESRVSIEVRTSGIVS